MSFALMVFRTGKTDISSSSLYLPVYFWLLPPPSAPLIVISATDHCYSVWYGLSPVNNHPPSISPSICLNPKALVLDGMGLFGQVPGRGRGERSDVKARAEKARAEIQIQLNRPRSSYDTMSVVKPVNVAMSPKLLRTCGRA